MIGAQSFESPQERRRREEKEREAQMWRMASQLSGPGGTVAGTAGGALVGGLIGAIGGPGGIMAGAGAGAGIGGALGSAGGALGSTLLGQRADEVQRKADEKRQARIRQMEIVNSMLGQYV